MPSVKIVCLGAGSAYFTRALGDLAIAEELAGSEVTLYDIDMAKCELMAHHGQRLADLSGNGLSVRACSTLADAIDGADFAVSSIGGAGESTGRVYGTSYHLNDILIPAKCGIHQIVGDTGGPGGMMMGLRSIPIYLEICHEMEKRCPNAILFNHSNPMAPLCRAMIKYSEIDTIGICHGVQGGIVRVAVLLGVPAHELETVWIGTNHYYWFTRMRHLGRDVMPEFWKRVRRQKPASQHRMSAELSQVYGHWIVYPEDDHIIEFYPYLAQAQDPTDLPFGMSEHGFGKRLKSLYAGEETLEEIAERDRAVSRRQMLKEYAARLDRVALPENPTDPVGGEGTARLIADIARSRRGVHICNVPNQGAVPNLPATAVLEVEAVTDSAGVRPIWAGEAPLALEALLRKRIAWQELVADAAVKGDRRLVLQAMQVDETAIPPEASEKLLAALLENSRGMLPTFEKKARRKI